jgi:predicted SnoaL-like aldol condensation-catalyzing enzyme
MSEANKAVLRRIYDEVFSQGRLEVVDEVVAADAVDHSPPPGGTGNTPEDLKAFTAIVREAFPDVRFRPVLELADGDKVVVQYEMTGTHEAPFLGIPPTGEPVTVTGVDIVTVVDGKVTEHWGWDDSWQLAAAAGPPPG